MASLLIPRNVSLLMVTSHTLPVGWEQVSRHPGACMSAVNAGKVEVPPLATLAAFAAKLRCGVIAVAPRGPVKGVLL